MMNCTQGNRAEQKGQAGSQKRNGGDLACSSETFICANNIKAGITLKVNAISTCKRFMIFKAKTSHASSCVILLYVPTKSSKSWFVRSGCQEEKMLWMSFNCIVVVFCLKCTQVVLGSQSPLDYQLVWLDFFLSGLEKVHDIFLHYIHFIAICALKLSFFLWHKNKNGLSFCVFDSSWHKLFP